jgi:hypothetical protein
MVDINDDTKVVQRRAEVTGIVRRLLLDISFVD